MRQSSSISKTAGIVGALSILVGGCFPYGRMYVFMPRPAEVTYAMSDQSTGAGVTALITVLGIREKDKARDTPTSIAVRMRVENKTELSVTISSESLRLFAGNLEQFPPAIVDGHDPIRIAPGDSEMLLALFPFPGDRYPGVFDTQGLHLKWTISLGQRAITRSATFIRYDRGSVYYSHNAHHH